LSDPVLVLNGDSYVELNLAATTELFRKRNATVVIVLQTVLDVARYGSVAIDAESRITEFVEKGTRTGAGLINAASTWCEKKSSPVCLRANRFRSKRMFFRHY
jgi:NDP-sugar pyrophosphorylase family protein